MVLVSSGAAGGALSLFSLPGSPPCYVFSTSAPSADLFCVPAEQPINITGLEPVRDATDNWLVAQERIVAKNKRDDAQNSKE